MPMPWANKQPAPSDNPLMALAQQQDQKTAQKPAAQVPGAPPKPSQAQTMGTIPHQNGPAPGDGVVTMQAGARGDTPVNAPGSKKRVGRWTLAQLRQTDGIIPGQLGTNKFASQKGMVGMGTGRDVARESHPLCTVLGEVPDDIARRSDEIVRAQSGSNRFASQRGMVGMGTARDVVRESHPQCENLAPVPEEKVLLSEGIVRSQAGTNRFASQKGMTGMGTNRRELTKMVDTKHPEYVIDQSLDQSTISTQMGTNRFASQKGMTGMGTNRRELTKMVDSKHPEYMCDASMDQATIGGQMGSNKFASQAGWTSFGHPRWEVLGSSISKQQRKSQGIVPAQMGSNQFASQEGMISFGTIRNTQLPCEGQGLPGDLREDDYKKSQSIIPSQAGWNRGESQRGYTSFGAPRDVHGKHLRRLWEIEYPEEAVAPQLQLHVDLRG